MTKKAQRRNTFVWYLFPQFRGFFLSCMKGRNVGRMYGNFFLSYWPLIPTNASRTNLQLYYKLWLVDTWLLHSLGGGDTAYISWLSIFGYTHTIQTGRYFTCNNHSGYIYIYIYIYMLMSYTYMLMSYTYMLMPYTYMLMSYTYMLMPYTHIHTC